MHGTRTSARKAGLYDYQKDAIRKVQSALLDSGSVVLQMPTGSGKTVTAAEIIRQESQKGPVWVICHRREIIQQTSKALSALGIRHDVIAPKPEAMSLGFGYQPGAAVVVASIQTLRRRDIEQRPRLVVWDECHHVAAASWRRIREGLGCAKHLGLTATPERLDGKGLSDWFEKLVTGPATRELIDGGWLSEFRYFAPSDPDLTNAKLMAGDYRKADIAKAMNMPVLIGDAIAEYQKNAAGKRALVFCASVDASKVLAERFNAAGIPALHVDGKTTSEERDAAVEALADGDIKVLSNVEVFTEGFDLPAIDAVILMRPTKSLSLFLQMIGRGLRTSDGKDEALIFDHAGLWLDHDWFDLPIEWKLDGGAHGRRRAARKHGPRRCPECKEVRLEREPVCGCGYEFPTGREIGEYDGALRELRGGLRPASPSGWMNKNQFSIRHGVTPSAVENWIERGLPVNGYQIPLEIGDVWVAEHTRLGAQKSGRMTPVKFAKKHEQDGLNVSSIYKLIEAGMPCLNGFVKEDEAINWFINWRSNWNPNQLPPKDVDNPEEYESRKDIAERLGVSAPTINRWVDSGLPCASNGWIKISDAESWRKGSVISINMSPLFLGDASCEYISPIAFGRQFGVTDQEAANWSVQLRRWQRNGCPHASNGWVVIEDVLKWAEEQNNPRLCPIWLKDWAAYENPTFFARRVGVYLSRVQRTFMSRGLPCASNGWVHIQKGLVWVRDNTKVKIPPEAWPSSDDRPI